MSTVQGEFRSTERFRVIARLGTGGMGVVYEVEDRLRDSRVALKTLRAVSGDGLLRFKNEFRQLREIEHPNLVSLHELIENAGQWFFTMELVRGQDFLRHVRPADELAARDTIVDASPAEVIPLTMPRGAFIEPRLRAALAGLARGLAALHEAGKVHRDIKPGNILITPDGRVVLLDFGLVTDARDSVEPRAMGTVGYMAPEQGGARTVGPAADWYGMGVLLYEALTGRLPYIGTPDDILAEKQLHPPDSPHQHAAGLPDDLAALALDLLSPDPAARPRQREILTRLGVDSSPVGHIVATSSFVGRGEELAALHAAYQQRPLTVFLRGDSGVGKSALMRRFIELLHEEEAAVVVLAGRCTQREWVPYKAVDGVIDALSGHIDRLSAEEAALVGQIFPVFQTDGQAGHVAEPRELRAQVFDALRRMLATVAEETPLVITIDDLQWADADSLALLAEVLRPSAGTPSILLIATTRGECAPLPGTVRVIEVGNLAPADGRELARRLLTQGRRVAAVDVSDAIAREARGHPLFIDELVRRKLEGRTTRLRLEDALWARVTTLPSDARALLEAIAVAGEPVALELVAATLARSVAETAAIAARLASANLARTTPSGAIEAYHDRVRQAVAANLDAAAHRAWHRKLAGALQAAGSSDPERLAIHLRESGERERAAAFAARAAEDANRALAFARAARLYRMAVQLAPEGPDRQVQRIQLAQTLLNAGRGGEAGEVFMEALPHASPGAAIDLTRQAAEAFLHSGRIDEGMAALEAVLAGVRLNLPKTRPQAMAGLLLRRAQLRIRGLGYREREPSSIPPAELARIDVCWSASASLGIFDLYQGAHFQTRHLLLALEAGEPRHIALALAVEAVYSAAPGPASHRRTAQLAAAGRELADRLGDPHAMGVTRMCSGMAAYLEGRFADVVPLCDEAESILRQRCTGVAWELFTAQLFGLWGRAAVGQLNEVGCRLPLMRREARGRGDPLATTTLAIGLCTLPALLSDEPEQARTEALAGMAQWPQKKFFNQHALFLLGEAEIDLYIGDPATALRRLDDAWPELHETVLRHIQLLRIEALHLHARAALALAAAGHDPANHRALAEADIRRIEHERVPHALAFAALLRAGLAQQQGKPELAHRHLDDAVAGFAAQPLGLYEAAARIRRADLAGLPDGMSAMDWLHSQGVRHPARLLAMLAPGFPTDHRTG